MVNIQDIINLCKDEQGKVFVMNEKGEVSLVILGIDEYHRLRSQVTQTPVDAEAVNKEILRAQLEDQTTPEVPRISLQNLVSKVSVAPRVDLREEVIDPSFDFDAPEEQV